MAKAAPQIGFRKTRSAFSQRPVKGKPFQKKTSCYNWAKREVFFVADRMTIDSNELLKKTVQNLIQREKELAELPLEIAKLPETEVFRPSFIEADPLKEKTHPGTLAAFNLPSELAPGIFTLSLAPSIGDREKIESCKDLVYKTDAPGKEELLRFFDELAAKEKDFQDIKKKLMEFLHS
jgi:hypothetical protein